MTGKEVYESQLFFDLEYFIIFFFSDAFYKTIELMSLLRKDKISDINFLFKLTLLSYILLIFVFNLILIFLITKIQ